MSFKCLFLTGGVVSSLGKGLTAASLALLLERHGLSVSMLKLDPYLNVDPGTMNPFEHGEIYVTDDGAETDLDLGHYYRFSSVNLSKLSTATSGQIYARVIKKEREGRYLGSTVQVVPHITNEIKEVIRSCVGDQKPDIVIVEIGGTVGDIESLPFLEAIRQFRYENAQDCLNFHMTYVPYLKASGEIKSKPTQHSVQTLRGIGVIPDAILCRSEVALSGDLKRKISLFCSVPEEAVFNIPDVEASVYELPLILDEESIAQFVMSRLGFSSGDRKNNLDDWKKLVSVLKSPKDKISVGVVGKYLQHKDAYKSIFESLSHAAAGLDCTAEIVPVDADKFDESSLRDCQACLVPGGFGNRGWEGKILAAKYCREHNLPYFGICLGLQVMVVEFARNVLGLKDADSLEMNPQTPHPVVCIMDEQNQIVDKGGTMRLGAYPCVLEEGSKVLAAYGYENISERHRHRYEVNNLYEEQFSKAGLRTVGKFLPQGLCEIMELENHNWMIGVQFHPEFKSKLVAPHPLFKAFISKAMSIRARS
ncbi:CTP synthase [Chlamydiifrater phoenicopteri]|uniref:CTP synthase n=1 Tax=Chlamydiifrater phoenicopteri TaxID=2681469 RepID=UPI001BCBC23D|nr:CTP synthase [Chlamydiifrater phoenicopteri]